MVQILRNGCEHMKQSFDIESINLDDLISTALNDPKAAGANIPAFHGLNFADLNTAYHQFCKNEPIATPVVDLGQVIDFFNTAATDLPDPTTLKGRKLPSLSVVLDGSGKDFADVFEPGNRRIWVPLADVPDQVQKAFVAAEDRRFYQHHGVDERGIIRAFIGDLAEPGRPQGGSTITQQVVKNLLVGEDVTYERKIREMIVASRLENTLSKNDILELYLNSAYLGRASWGVEMAARSYFGKSAKDLTLGEGAMLAGLLKGPNYYNPDRHPDRAKDRLTYVLDRMQEDGVITAAQKNQALASPPKLIAFTPSAPRQRVSFRRFPRPRGQGRRRRQPDRRTPTRCTRPSMRNCSAIPKRRCRKAWRITKFRPAAPSFAGRKRISPTPCRNSKSTTSRRCRRGNRRCRPCTCRSTTCIGRRPWCCRRAANPATSAIRVGLPDGRIVPLTTWSATIRRSSASTTSSMST